MSTEILCMSIGIVALLNSFSIIMCVRGCQMMSKRVQLLENELYRLQSYIKYDMTSGFQYTSE